MTALVPGRPPARALRTLVALETKMAWREPAGLLLGLALPLFFLVVFGAVPTFRMPAPMDPRVSLFTYFVPMWICLSASLIALFSLPIPLVRDREKGWLRRISTTPLAPSWLLAAQTVVNGVLALLAVAVLTLGSTALFGMPAPVAPVAYALAALLLITAMFAIALLLAAVAPTSRAVAGLGNLVLYPLLFFSGIWLPRESMAPVLRTISDLTPLGAAGQALRTAALDGVPPAGSYVVLAVWTVVLGGAAIRFFRWE